MRISSGSSHVNLAHDCRCAMPARRLPHQQLERVVPQASLRQRSCGAGAADDEDAASAMGAPLAVLARRVARAPLTRGRHPPPRMAEKSPSVFNARSIDLISLQQGSVQRSECGAPPARRAGMTSALHTTHSTADLG